MWRHLRTYFLRGGSRSALEAYFGDPGLHFRGPLRDISGMFFRHMFDLFPEGLQKHMFIEFRSLLVAFREEEDWPLLDLGVVGLEPCGDSTGDVAEFIAKKWVPRPKV